MSVFPQAPHFLIFARPRSRTAWLANFLTYGDTFCLHEPMADHQTFDELGRRLQLSFGADVERVGFVDTSLIHRPQDALDAFPRAHVLFLASSPAGFRRFAIKHKLAPELVELVNRDYDRAWAHLVGRATFLDAEGITLHAATARQAWNLTTGTGKPFPMERWRALRGLNVQVEHGDLAARIRRMASR